MRDRIDWANLKPLPRKRPDTGATREDLAEIRFTRGKAKHKGRNHISNTERRLAKIRKARDDREKADKNKARFARYLDAVRAYWRGDSDEHPTGETPDATRR